MSLTHRDDFPPRPDEPTAALPTLPPAPVACEGETETLPPSSAVADITTLATTATTQRVAVPGYEILGELGRGGMGVVYKARHIKLGRLVAMKMILVAEHAGPAERDRFQTEAEAVARLQHPNIVQIYEVGEQDGRPFFSLEFCAGGSLETKLNGTPLPPREAARLAETLARAMHAAHEAGIVHRDLKPANVLLAADGTPKITDFGLAKKLDEAGQTATGSIMGTPSYMAPEQAGGQSKEIGPRTDVYALGAILYELLTGRPPFRAATPLDTIMQAVSDEPVPPSQLQSKTPRDLETICLKCLQKEPGKRYVGAAALAEDLRRFQNGEPIQARPVGRVERSWRWCKRNPVGAGLVAALIVGTSVATGLAVWALGERNRADRNAAAAQENEQRALREKEEKDEQLTRAEWLLYANQIAFAQREWKDGNVGHARQLLDSCRQDFRGWEHNYLHTLFNSNQRTFRGHGNRVWSVAFSPDGKLLASASGDETVRVWDMRSGQQLLTLKHPNNGLRVAFSPDGKHLASASPDGIVKVWDSQSGQEVHALKGPPSDLVEDVAFSGDSPRVASASIDGTVKVWDANTDKEVLALKGCYRAAFSPDGKRLASNNVDMVKVWDVQSGQEVRALPKSTGVIHSMAFSSDGKRLAGGMDGTVKVWDVQTGQEILFFNGHPKDVTSLAFSPDGKRLVSASADRTVKVWDAQTGQRVLTLQGHSEEVSSVAYSPDGKQLASGSWDGTVKVWDPSISQGPLTLENTSSVRSVVFSPDGKRLANTNGGGVNIWEPKSAQLVRVLGGHGPLMFSCVAFSPDGERLAGASEDSFFKQPGEMKVWDAQSGRELMTLTGHTTGVMSVAFSPAGDRLASMCLNGHVKVWDAQTGHEVLSLQENSHGGRGLAFSPDGKRLAIGNGSDVNVLDAQDGRELLSLKSHTNVVWSIAFSPDGKRLAGGSDRTVKVWDALSGEEILTLKGHTDQVFGVCFSPDGKRLASASMDQTVKVWEARTGQELLSLQEHTGGVNCAIFSPDGKHLASASDDRTVRLWDADQ